MKKTLQVINDIKQEGIIAKYALGGATALLFYTEPALTFDVDIFIFLPGVEVKKSLVNISPLYKCLNSKGYHAEKKHVVIEGIPVQFIPAYNSLVEEAVKHSSVKKYESVDVPVLTIEYLMAIMVDTNRPEDRERIKKILTENQFNKNTLNSILKRHGLLARWEKIVKTK